MNAMKTCSGCQKPLKARAIMCLAVAVLSVASGGEFAKAPEPEKYATYRDILATRPAPDLTRLAKLSAPEVQGPAAMESFYDILKLRENANAAALPVQVLCKPKHWLPPLSAGLPR